MLSGKHFNGAVSLYKIVFEAMLRVRLQEFEASLTESSMTVLNEDNLQIEELKLELNRKEFYKVLP